ncbi:MAG: 50S ribosomal protein L4 [Vicinamibacterales bacterium]
MKLDIVNGQNEKVGSFELGETFTAGPVKADLIWESVVRQNASERRGTHMTKNRALVSGSGRKPWRQKGTGRARVGEARNPLWRKGGTVFGPQPRSYDYALPRKVERGALRSAMASRLRAGDVIVVEALAAETPKTKETAAMFRRIGATGKTLVTDVVLDDAFARSARNIAGVRLVPSGRLTPRDVMDAGRIVVTRAALERLQEVLR